ncbi:MAG: glycosyltransferase family 4 protein [bacterium]|jgi:glycosyltransferase involved in cell wall biosynthesis
MKILEFITTSNIGGAENYIVNLSKKFADKGHEVFILSSAGEKDKNPELSIFKFLQNSGIPFKIMNTGFKYNPLAILRIAYFIKKNKFDIIHTHLSKANFVGALAAKIAGIKSISTAHGLNKKSQYKYADYIICVSNAVRENLIFQGMNGGRLVAIYNGIDTGKFNPEAEGLPKRRDVSASVSGAGGGGKSFNIGMIARLSREKGVDLFLDAAKLVLAEIPGAKFFIAGTGFLKDELIKRAKDLDIYNSVYFIGFVGDTLVSFLKELDAVVFPSLKEGLPLALLESMAMENIVIASDAGGMPEVVEDGKNGFIIKKGDINAIYQKLIFVYNNKDKDAVNEIAEEARKTIIEKFNIENCANKTLDLFSKYV